VFSLIGLLLVAPLWQLDVSNLVLFIMAVGCVFTMLRTVAVVRFAGQVMQAVRRYGRPEAAADGPALKWRHVIVVPIYKESAETIENTLRTLADHGAAAAGYVVLCAHEKADPDHEAKFRRLHAALGHRFLGLIGSVHVVAPHECPGKAANVNYAVRAFAAAQPSADRSNVMVTVIDSDTLIHPGYFVELERRAAAVANPHAVVFAAPTFFEINRYEVPCLVRAMDDLWSLSAAANIFSNSRLGFPISNYSQSLQMLEAMDYWDVDPDSVGEDFHTFIKATVVLDDDVRLVPISVPMNNRNVVGHTYAQSLVARYSQAMRHALGVSSTAYLLQHLLAARFSLRKWVVLLLCLESHCFPLLYFAAGLHVVECVVAGDFLTYFHDGKLWLFVAFGIIGFLCFNLIFALYKLVQFVARHRLFRRPYDLRTEMSADLCDFFVQGTSALAYFMVPFGYRAWQNLTFRTNKTFYGKLEAGVRRY